jgi:hypothetical protein
MSGQWNAGRAAVIGERLCDAIDPLIRRLRRRNTVLATLVLAVPLAALAQPLGLLLWARIRLLTNIPRTAMATESEETLASIPAPPAFPDLPNSDLPVPGLRDPLAISPRHFPRADRPQALTETSSKSGLGTVDDEGRAAAVLRERLAGVVGRLRVQGLVPGRGVALIDGRVRRIGESFPATVDGTTVRLVAVEQSMVVVECGGLEFDIRLDGGGTDSVVIRPQGEELNQP